MKDQITVEALIAELKKLPRKALVSTEGCDCTGPAVGAKLLKGRGDDGEDIVMICRKEGW